MSKFFTWSRVVHWKPSIVGFSCCSRMWACCIMSQSSHPTGSLIRSKWASVRITRAPILFTVPWLMPTVITVSQSLLSYSEQEEVQEVVVAGLGLGAVLHALNFQVVLWLFGILFNPKQYQWKNLPFLQDKLWHSTNLSAGLDFDFINIYYLKAMLTGLYQMVVLCI